MYTNSTQEHEGGLLGPLDPKSSSANRFPRHPVAIVGKQRLDFDLGQDRGFRLDGRGGVRRSIHVMMEGKIARDPV